MLIVDNITDDFFSVSFWASRMRDPVVRGTDPDPVIRVMDPDLDPSTIRQKWFSQKLYFYCYVTFYEFLYL